MQGLLRLVTCSYVHSRLGSHGAFITSILVHSKNLQYRTCMSIYPLITSVHVTLCFTPYIVFEVLACAGKLLSQRLCYTIKRWGCIAYNYLAQHTSQTVGGDSVYGKPKWTKIGSAHQICCTSLAPPLPIPYGTRVKFMT